VRKSGLFLVKNCKNRPTRARASAENFPVWGGATEKYRKIALFSLFQGEANGKSTEK